MTKLPMSSLIAQLGASSDIAPNGNLLCSPFGSKQLTLNLGGVSHGHTNSHKVMVNLANMAHTDSQQYSGVDMTTKIVYMVGTKGKTIDDGHAMSGNLGSSTTDTVCGPLITVNQGKKLMSYTAVSAKSSKGLESHKVLLIVEQAPDVNDIGSAAKVTEGIT